MSIIAINDGDEAKSSVLRNNFEYLDNITNTIYNDMENITNQTNIISNKVNSLVRQQEEFETNINNIVNTNIDDMTTRINEANTNVSKSAFRPNWNAGEILATGATHTINRNGWILFRSHDYDNSTWYINNNVIGWNLGFYGKWIDNNSCLCPVSVGDTAMTTSGLIQFFPNI